ncbi:uncharacterized protein LOC112515517 [Cynara cardunculus var. scolymus]|uniref:Uncharacterized protein n=1 Tax=Cynara cardunculus var. scolymus TaxID=59895 RepID=A0A103XK92_CYNCS|nr:uncharacterized protein LOC112515517 [Cynara cardunculus var. scolymus]KVH92239.1 hypothetical protein Ccrd_005727 [Cynara cardunculus var. scolymus]
MAPLHFQKVLFLLLFFTISFLASSATLQPSIQLVGSRDLLEIKDSDGIQIPVKKKKLVTTPDALATTKNKNNTKLIKPTTTTTVTNSTKLTANKNSTKINKLQEKTIVKLKLNATSKPSNSNSTKLTSKPSNSTKPISKSLNSTKPILKSSNSTKPTSLLSQKSTDPAKKNKPTIVKKEVKKSTKPVGGLTYREDDDEDDFVSEFRDLPSRFQETLLPDLEVLSSTSKAYLNKANKQISKGFNPIVGKKYAPMVASIISFAFILIPFLLVSLIFNRIKAYFSLQKLVIFIQIYLSIYFSILSLSSIVTGLEPLKFFYATSQSTYICIQLLQTLAYVLYLLVLLMYLVLVFSTESAMASKLLGLGQTFVGFAVGLHYYMTVFHRAVLRQPPKTSWKVHAVYATCFLLICLLGTAERRKKAYVVDGSEEGKKS